jgi:hypothetical protein
MAAIDAPLCGCPRLRFRTRAGLAGTRRLARRYRGRTLAGSHARRRAGAGADRACLPREFLRGRRVGAMGERTPSDRSRVGVDPHRRRTLSRVRASRRRDRGVQRPIHGRTVRAARGIVRDTRQPHSPLVPELLSAEGALAVHRRATCQDIAHRLSPHRLAGRSSPGLPGITCSFRRAEPRRDAQHLRLPSLPFQRSPAR